MSDIIISVDTIKDRIFQQVFVDVLAPIGFEAEANSLYTYQFPEGEYDFFFRVTSYQTAGYHVEFGAIIKLKYVSEIFGRANMNNPDYDPKPNTLNPVCNAHGAFFYKKRNFHYEIITYEQLEHVVKELAHIVQEKVITYYRKFTSVQEIDNELNLKNGVFSMRGNISPYLDPAYNLIVGLIIAKLCRPQVFESLFIEYRKTIINPFYLNRYDPAVEYLLKTDISTYRHIQPPF